MRFVGYVFLLVTGSAASMSLIAAQVAVLRALATKPPDRGERSVVVFVPPAPAPAAPEAPPPAPPPPPEAEREPILAPATAPVPFAAHRWRGVAVSPDRNDVVAAWTKNELRVSRDGGASFDTALPFGVGPVAVASDGTVYAANEDCRLAVIDRKGGARLTDGIYCETELLAARSGRLVAVNTSYPDETHIRMSSDGGKNWEEIEAPEGGRELPYSIYDIAIDRAGHVELSGQHFKGGECGAAYNFRWQIDRDGEIHEEAGWPGHLYDSVMLLGLDGWAYTTCSPQDGTTGPGCVVDPDGELHILRDLSLSSQADVQRGRRAAYLFAEGRIHRAARKQVTLVAQDAPLDFSPRGVDADDRVYGILGGSVVSWSSAGWRLHLGFAGDPDAEEEGED